LSVLVVAAMTASCRRRSKRSRHCQGRDRFRSSSPSIRSTSRTPSRIACAPNCCRRDSGRVARGDVVDVEVSATKKINIDKLLEMLACRPKSLDLKANPNRPAEGTVIESQLDRGRGSVATVLVQRGR